MSRVNKTAVAAAFGRAAQRYEQYAELQRRCGDALIARLPNIAFGRVLDAGCGTGWYSRYWQRQGAQVCALDLAPEMIVKARTLNSARHYLTGDIEHLPLAERQFDLVWSNLAVQWCESLSMALGELWRVAAPHGRVAFTTLCAGSLPELKTAWRAVDRHPHVNRFLSIDQIAAARPPKARLALEPMTVTLGFPDALSAMRSLKGIGATHLLAGRKPTLLTHEKLSALSLAWPQQQGQFLLTYHLISGVIQRE